MFARASVPHIQKGVSMARKRVSSVDLNWMIVEQMKDGDDCPVGLSIAVIPDDKLGWRAIVNARSQRRLNARAMRRFAAIQKELQASYSLSND
jgi:hypothetical protein